MKWIVSVVLLIPISLLSSQEASVSSQESARRINAFIEANCLDCHDVDEAKGGLSLENLSLAVSDTTIRNQWIEIFDRVQKREMPPKQVSLPITDREAFLSHLDPLLIRADFSDIRKNGRGPFRRLTRSEFEHNLRDLLQLPNLDIRDLLPGERTSHGFSKASASLDMSRVQLSAYLDAAEAALRSAIASGTSPSPQISYRAEGTDLYPKLGVHAGRESMHFSKNDRMVPISNTDLKKIEETDQQDPDLEMALFRSATWPFYGYPRRFVAKHSGQYRVRFSARAVRQLPGFRLVPAIRPVPMTFRARQPSLADVSGDVRATGGIIDVQPTRDEYETSIRLKAGETFEYSLLGLPVPHPITSHGGPLYYNFPPMPPDGHRGIAFQWLEVLGPLQNNDWPSPSHQFLFGDLPIRDPNLGSAISVEVDSSNPSRDAKHVMTQFARNAARQPIQQDAITPFLTLIENELEKSTFTEAVMTGFQAFLCSSLFLTLPEPMGSNTNTHFAIASRLSHFLWDSRPDRRLLNRAKKQELRNPEVLNQEVNRMIRDAKFDRFVKNFTDEWLDLDQLRRDGPDIRLYPEYRKDDYLVDSMERETRTFFSKLVKDNLPILELINSRTAFVNDRLSRHYGLRPVSGSAIREVALTKGSPYGGLITQAAIMKLTANGTTTSPVIRGAWIMSNILGDPPPNPPESVPAVQPDLRGAKSVREILAAHTESNTCASCHARFDPVGFALENFDIMGAWRDHYRGLEKGDEITGIDRAGHRYSYRIAQPIDASGTLLTGDSFQDINGVKRLLGKRQRQLAKNLLQQLTLYGTGTPIRFSDRRVIESILDDSAANQYRVKDLILGLVQSRIFLGTDPETE